jgi:hypothetical protein
LSLFLGYESALRLIGSTTLRCITERPSRPFYTFVPDWICRPSHPTLSTCLHHRASGLVLSHRIYCIRSPFQKGHISAQSSIYISTPLRLYTSTPPHYHLHAIKDDCLPSNLWPTYQPTSHRPTNHNPPRHHHPTLLLLLLPPPPPPPPPCSPASTTSVDAAAAATPTAAVARAVSLSTCTPSAPTATAAHHLPLRGRQLPTRQ